jgi:preprotein translocase subunit YajC
VSSNAITLIVLVVVFGGMLAFTTRARRRQATVIAERVAQIGVGTEVMTTSGLYGTVVARNDDETAVLSIAPGVEVKWALAALRDVASLPGQLRAGDRADDPADDPADDAAGDPGERAGRVDLDKPGGSNGEDGGTAPRS